jgi:tRNA (guanine37-N1)-methyltransferase
MKQFNIISIFPDLISHYCAESILGRAQNRGIIDVRAVDLREFTNDKHKSVDDTPYGGGAGMIMKPEPIYSALASIDGLPFVKASGLTKLKRIATGGVRKKKRTVLLSPRGRQFDQDIAEQWSKLDELVLICGRYEGVDQRVTDYMIDEEISVGPYVLAGGELGALIVIEAISRLIPGVLGNSDSLKEETFSLQSVGGGDRKEYPQYTKPSDFMGWKVPDVLLSGDHKNIQKWRKEESK